MIRFLRRVLTVFAILQLVCIMQLLAQKPNVKFGKVSEEELQMPVYSADSSAHAAILYDYGETEFRYDVTGDKGWQVIFTRTVRVKVFDKEGVSAGDFHFTLNHNGTSSKEKISDIEGITFNLENGKITKTKLDRKNIIESDEDKYHVGCTFAMPNVKAGSVIDLNYRIESDYIFNLQPWRFQYSIPVQWSEYYVSIPEYFIYNHTLLGYNALITNEITEGRGSISFNTSTHAEGFIVKATSEHETIDYSLQRYRLAMKDVPAFKEEDYLSTPDNYMSTYSFELASSKGTDNVYKNYTSTWEKINTLLLEDDHFGLAIKRKGFIEDAMAVVTAGCTTETAKTLAIFEFLKKKIRWNNYNSESSVDIRKAWNEGSGSTGDINLILVSALRSAGIDAMPVALSTRKNGRINLTHPSLSDLNYVVALVKADSVSMFLDATEPLAPAGLLPERCLNGDGRIIDKTKSDWVSLTPKQVNKHSGSYTFTLNSDGSIQAKAEHLRDGYNALDFRKDVAASSSIDDFYTQKEKKITGLTFTKKDIPTLDSIYKPLTENLEFSIDDAADMNSDLILINPLQFEATTRNPFRLKERQYPVEFPYQINETLMVNWIIPEGYTIDQLPKPALVTLPDNGGKFTYNVVKNGNTVMVISIIKINKTVFLNNEYEYIKEFFNQIIAKQAESMVIKKI